MEHLQPKFEKKKKSSFYLSEKIMLILYYYSKYSKYSEDEIVEHYLEEMMNNGDFVRWLKNQPYNKRIKEVILDEIEEEQEECTN